MKPTELDSMNRLRVQAENKAALYRRALDLACYGGKGKVAFYVSAADANDEPAAASGGVTPPFERGSWQHAVDDQLVCFGRTSEEFATPHEAMRWLLEQTSEAARTSGVAGIPDLNGYAPDGPVGMALSWLGSALKCPTFQWDSDQREYAEKSLKDAEAWLAELMRAHGVSVFDDQPKRGEPPTA